MDEPGLAIVVRDRGVPTVAMCQRCKVKFFVPPEHARKSRDAEAYLWERHDSHKCKPRQAKERELRYG